MIELDFLMIYEHKVRELENLCLIKYELERRGYSVKILHIDDKEMAKAVKPIYHAKVVVLMACYRDSTLEWHTKDFVKFDKVIDMQWENIVYPKDENNPDVFKNYSGIGKEVVRVSWGEANRRRLVNVAHMNPDKVKLIGHIGMDFLRDEIKDYYISKEQLFKEYDLPLDKKIILFTSPYYADNLPKDYIDDMCSRFGTDWLNYYDFMTVSESIILDWFKTLCSTRKDLVVIYRPHPGHIGDRMHNVEAECDNFRIITDRSVKQWILVSDKIYTGNSSCFVEAFFAKKMCHFLFPIPITEGFELKIINNADRIVSYEEFERSIDNDSIRFPVKEEAINEVYSIDWEVPSYVKFADMAEDVIKEDKYNLTKEQLKSYRTKQPLLIRCQKMLSKNDYLYNRYLALVDNENIHWKWIENQRILRQTADRIAEELSIEASSEEEIENITKKIKDTIEGVRNE